MNLRLFSMERSRTACRKYPSLRKMMAVVGFGILTLGVASHTRAQVADPNMRISQVYTRGGEPGAIYQNDFIELFNRGNSSVDINGWSLTITSSEGGNISRVGIKLVSNTSILIPPGKHLLFQFPGNGSNGQPIPFADFQLPSPVPGLGGTGAQIALLGKDQTLAPGVCPASPDLTGAVVDFVGYGDATCAEGTKTLAPPPDKSLLRIDGGCTDNNNNLTDFSFATPNPRSSQSAVTLCGQGFGSVIDFGAAQFDVFEGQGAAQVIVTRTGDVSTPATVDYFASNGTASERSDYTTTLGTLHFAPGETQKTIDILITDDATAEANETVFLGLLNARGNAGIGPRNSAELVIHDNDAGAAPNPVDESSFFVRQHYNDFLNRQADPIGLAFWVNNIESCGSDTQCREVKRIDTSAAFFLSIEFQRTGFLVYRIYKAALPETSQRPRAMPRYREFVGDTQEIGRNVRVGDPGWEAQLEANTVAFTEAFVGRAEFLTNYPLSLTRAQYVDKLNTQAGGVLTQAERDALVNGTDSRAVILRKIAENSTFSAAEFNRAFVLMQYFGYLRRNANDTPNTDFSGFDFWLAKLNQFGGDYRGAELVKAFITSLEYRGRFGTP